MVSAFRAPVIGCMCTDFHVDSSRRFTFTAQTVTDKVTDAPDNELVDSIVDIVF